MRRKTIAILVPVLLAIVPVLAYAYFTTTGAGSAQASTGSLTPSSINSATPGAGTVALSWSSVTAPATGSVSYYVTRDGGIPAGNCAPSTAPTTATACTDSGLAAGNHSYTVTAVWRTWTAKSSSTSVTLASGAATKLLLVPATATPAAGAADNLTITAQDSANNTVTAYTGDKSLTFSGAGASSGGFSPTVSDKTGVAKVFGSATTITFASGVASISGANNGVMKLYKAETANIVVSDGSISGSRSVTVSPASAASLSVSGYPSPTVAGVGNSFSVKALDAFGNTATGYSGTVAFAATNDATAVLPANSTLTSGTGSFSATFKTVAGGTKTLTATDTVSSSITGAQSGITVSPASAASLSVSGYPSPTVAGVSHSFGVTALDAFGNIATGYSGTVAFTATNDAQAVRPVNSTLTSGTGSFSATFKTVAGGTKTLTATDTATPSITGSQSGISVTPAGAASLSVSGYASPTVAGVSHSFGVTALDAFGNAASGYSGTVAFTATNDAGAVLPVNSTLTSGTGSFSATFKTVAGGTKTLTATDTVSSSITGSQSGISVTPTAAASIAVSSGSGQSANVSTAFASPLVALVTDTFGNAVSGVSVTFTGPTSGASGTFASTGCTSNSPTSTCVATTASDGKATSSTFTANSNSGGYNVSASAAGAGSVNFSLTNTILDTFQVSLTGPLTAGTPASVTITAKSGATTDTSYSGTKCLVFSGPATSPNSTAPTYPPQGTCAAGESSVSFNNGTTGGPITLTMATAATTLTVTQGSIAGTSASFAVNSAGVAFSFTPSCPVLLTKQSNNNQFAVTVPNDAFGNPFTRASSLAVSLAFSPTGNFSFASTGTATASLSMTSAPFGPTNTSNTFLVNTNGASKTSTLTATASGFTTGSCTVNSSG